MVGKPSWNKDLKIGASHPQMGFQKGHSAFKGKHSEESRHRMSIAQKKVRKEKPYLGFQKGESNVGYIKDRTKLKTARKQAYDVRYKDWMLSVKNRDNWKCKILNGDCSGRLEAHHIVPWEKDESLRYEINNGITLCVYHHPRKRADEERLSLYFRDLLVNET